MYSLTFLAVPHLGLPSTVDPKVKLNENLQGIPYVHLSGVGFAQPVIGDRGMDTRRRQSSFSSYLLSSSSESEIREEVAGGGVGGRWRFYKVTNAQENSVYRSSECTIPSFLVLQLSAVKGVHPTMKISYLVVFGALCQMVKVRSA